MLGLGLGLFHITLCPQLTANLTPRDMHSVSIFSSAAVVCMNLQHIQATYRGVWRTTHGSSTSTYLISVDTFHDQHKFRSQLLFHVTFLFSMCVNIIGNLLRIYVSPSLVVDTKIWGCTAGQVSWLRCILEIPTM